MLQRVTDEVRAPETASPERIVVEAEAEHGGRSRGGRAPWGSPSGWAGSGEVVESCGGESKLGVLYIAAPRRLPRTGFSDEVITAALRLYRRFQRLNVVVGDPWFHFGANRVGIWGFRGSSTKRAARARRRQGACSVRAAPRRRCCMRALARRWPRGATRTLGRRRTALRRRSASCQLLRRCGCRKTRRRRQARAPLMPGRRQARV